MTNIRYKAVCKICATYCIKEKVEDSICEIQRGYGDQPNPAPKKCEKGKHNLVIFEIKEEK